MKDSADRQATNPITGRLTTGGAGMRQCGYCGQYASVNALECPKCHERFPAHIPAVSRPRFESHGELRRGILYMALAGVVHYFAGGYSNMELPIPIPPVVPEYLTPLLFLGGLGFVLYGLLRRAGHALPVNRQLSI